MGSEISCGEGADPVPRGWLPASTGPCTHGHPAVMHERHMEKCLSFSAAMEQKEKYLYFSAAMGQKLSLEIPRPCLSRGTQKQKRAQEIKALLSGSRIYFAQGSFCPVTPCCSRTSGLERSTNIQQGQS